MSDFHRTYGVYQHKNPLLLTRTLYHLVTLTPVNKYSCIYRCEDLSWDLKCMLLIVCYFAANFKYLQEPYLRADGDCFSTF